MSAIPVSVASVTTRSWAAKSVPYQLVLVSAVFFIPMKALAINAGGQSLYIPYLAMPLVLLFAARHWIGTYCKHFLTPTALLFAFSLFHFAVTGFQLSVFVFFAKIVITLLMAALYVYLLSHDEDTVLTWLQRGLVVSVVYMLYQAISFAVFRGGLPFTVISAFEIGRGLGQRFGLPRVTGFTEEPSYIAVILLGSLFTFFSYSKRTGQKQNQTTWILIGGLLLCTSNSLFASIPLLLLYWLLLKLRLPFVFFAIYYASCLSIAPFVLNLDESFFARFSPYTTFLHGTPITQCLGIGFNQYSTLPVLQFHDINVGTVFEVQSLASLWGGLLLEGGILFTILFCFYISRISALARDGAGYAFISILLMLSDYYSPWWPVVSFALAYAIVSRRPYSVLESPKTPLVEV